MVITVFRSRLRAEHEAEFHALAEEMMEAARAMPGFRSYRVYRAEDGERASLIEFDTAEQLRAWREHPGHRRAQALGRERFYESYSLQVCEPVRESHFDRERD